MSPMDELKKRIVARFDARIMALMKEYDKHVQASEPQSAERIMFAIHEIKNLGLSIGHDFWEATKPE